MYYITKIDSLTGQKFAQIATKRKECHTAQKKIAEEIGFEKWRSSPWKCFGGISSCIFQKDPDEKIWRKVEGHQEWKPRRNTKQGKEIWKRFQALPTVDNCELNLCVGYDENWSTIGFASNNPEYFGFEGFEDWDHKVPRDCKEVTRSKYKQLFNN